jgi:hypothetical protein
MFPTKRRGLTYTKIAPAVIISNKRLLWIEIKNLIQGTLIGVPLGLALVMYLYSEAAFDSYFFICK